MSIALKKIDLKKCTSKEGSGSFHDHPDISGRKQYLAKIGGEFCAGRFNRQWYGWNFDGWPGNANYQLDMPGTNASDWKGLWEIVQLKKARKGK